ncbi:MAG: aldo/keto reductase family oxidoreductase [Succinivibrio sp.]
MEYIEFGCDKKSVSKIILGLMRIPKLDVQKTESLLLCAKDNGINFLDIADCYSEGYAEELLGKTFKNNSSLRDSFFLQSKCGIRKDPDFTYFDFSKDYIISCVENSLKRMNTDHIDCLLLHRPDVLMEPEEIGEAFNTLRAQGKVLNFGVSNMNPMQIRLLKSGLDCDLVTDQLQLSICHTPIVDAAVHVNMDCDAALMRDGGILEFCRLNKMVIQAWSVMQYGFFKGVFVGSPLYLKLNQVLQRIADENEVTPQAVAVAWVLRLAPLMQAVIGTTQNQRLEQSVMACDFTLTKKEWYELYLAAGNDLP